VTLTNPISIDRTVMRHSVLSSVLEIAAENTRFLDRIALFEIGDVYLANEEGILPDELTRLVIVLTGMREEAHWQEGTTPQKMDFYDLKGVLEGLFAALNMEVSYEAAEHPTFRPGRTARILWEEMQLGVMGEIHPLVARNYGPRIDRDQPILAADIDLEIILTQADYAQTFEPISPYPAVREDLALVVDRQIPAAEVYQAIMQAGGFLLKEVELFDVYQGSQLPPGKKSLAYHLTFESPNKTLTDKEVRKQREKILQQMERRFGARLR
jgi:phenylalanyl-tRNA synthetase beta chain